MKNFLTIKEESTFQFMLFQMKLFFTTIKLLEKVIVFTLKLFNLSFLQEKMIEFLRCWSSKEHLRQLDVSIQLLLNLMMQLNQLIMLKP